MHTCAPASATIIHQYTKSGLEGPTCARYRQNTNKSFYYPRLFVNFYHSVLIRIPSCGGKRTQHVYNVYASYGYKNIYKLFLAECFVIFNLVM